MPNPKPTPPQKKTPSTYRWLIFTSILLIAAGLRFYRLFDIPWSTFFDPAINGLDAVRILQRGGPVIFFPTNGGREPLFVYLILPFITLFGTIPFSLRGPMATAGLLNVALLIGFLQQLPLTTPPRQLPLQTYRRWLAIFGGLLLATSYWHVMVSRLGQRPVLAPMLAVPMIWFFLKGWHTKKARWLIGAGILMGLQVYGYSAGRLLPVILGLALIPEFFINRHQLLINLRSLFIFGLAAAITFAPMGWYMVTHPSQFAARAGSVMIWNFLGTPEAIVAELGRNLLRVLGYFCCVGSSNAIFGYPHTPGLPWLLTPFLLIGLVISLKRWRELFFRLLSLWWLIGISPSIISIEAPHPLRMIMALIPTIILVALGLTHTLHHLQQYIARGSDQLPLPILAKTYFATRRTLLLWAACLLILLPTPWLFYNHFVRWPQSQTTQGIFNYRAMAIRNAILAHPDQTIYLPIKLYNDHPLLFFLSQSHLRQAQLNSPINDDVMAILPEKGVETDQWVRLADGQATVLPPLTTDGLSKIEQALDRGTRTPIQTISGETVAQFIRLNDDPAQYLQQPTQTAAATFGPINLTGIHYAPNIQPDEGQLPVTLYWQANQSMSTEYDVVLQLVDDDRNSLGDGSGRPTDWVYPTTFWRPKIDDIASSRSITLETVPQPGRYWLAIALFDATTATRLPHTSPVGDSPDTIFIGPLKVPRPFDAAQSKPISDQSLLDTAINFGDEITLSALAINNLNLAPGETLTTQLLWTAQQTPSLDYTIFLHLLDEAGNLVAGNDSQPLTGQYPTTIWSPAEQILDPHAVSLPPDLPPGQYTLALGLYHQPTSERLPLVFEDGGQDMDGRFVLDKVIIQVR